MESDDSGSVEKMLTNGGTQVVEDLEEDNESTENFTMKKYSFDEASDGALQMLKERNQNVGRSQSLGQFDRNHLMAQFPHLDENFLIGRRNASAGNVNHSRSYVRITEVVPCNSCLVQGKSLDDVPESWRTPVKIFSDKRRGKPEEDKKLSRRIRSYYKGQDELIKAYEDIQLDTISVIDQETLDRQLQKRAEILAKLSFFLNLVLLIIKAVAVALSSSMSIISSLVDSVIDLLSGIIIWWTSNAMKKRDIYLYPGGRSRLEPTAIVILSVIMSLASFQLIVESIQIIVAYASSEGNLPTVQLPVILITSSTVVTKFILYILCRFLAYASSSVQALAQDHRNDVMSNLVAIVCGYLGSQQFVATVSEENVKYIDPIGAILISIYILVNWWRTGYEQIKLLTGHTADTNFLSKITWICLNHHREIIFIDTVRAFHFGNNFLVEVDIVLPEDMSLKEAHNIGETLQQKLEKFQLVERAFVHLDYEIEHNPNEEHKVI